MKVVRMPRVIQLKFFGFRVLELAAFLLDRDRQVGARYPGFIKSACNLPRLSSNQPFVAGRET
jgi:hypothetical protein